MSLKKSFIETAFKNKSAHKLMNDYVNNTCKLFFRPMEDEQRYGIFVDGNMNDDEARPFHSVDEIVEFMVDSFSKATIREMVESDFQCEDVDFVGDLMTNKGNWIPSLREHIVFLNALVDSTSGVCSFCRKEGLKFNNKSDVNKLKEFVENEKL